MRIGKTAGAAVVAASLVFGVGAATAGASPAASTQVQAAGHDKVCDKAATRLERLRDDRQRLETRIDKLQAERDAARDHHHEDKAERIQHRIDTLQDRHTRLEARIDALQARCGSTPTAPAAPAQS